MWQFLSDAPATNWTAGKTPRVPAEIACNQYLQTTLPAPADNFTGETIHLQSSPEVSITCASFTEYHHQGYCYTFFGQYCFSLLFSTHRDTHRLPMSFRIFSYVYAMNEPRIIFHGIVYYEKKIIPFHLQAFLSPMISQFWLRQLQNNSGKSTGEKIIAQNVPPERRVQF